MLINQQLSYDTLYNYDELSRQKNFK